MMYSRLAMAAGVVLILLGTIFHFQGRGQIGPESSFMYQSSDWIDYGLLIAVIGIGALGLGIMLLRRRT